MNVSQLIKKDEVESFAEWFMNRPFWEMSPPLDALRDYGLLTALVIFRQPPYQVEFCTVKKDSYFDYHSHPNVDSIEIAAYGDLTFEIDDKKIPEQILRVKPGVMHRAKTGNLGGAFFSIQYWLNGVIPTAVGLDWEGSLLSKKHEEILERK